MHRLARSFHGVRPAMAARMSCRFLQTSPPVGTAAKPAESKPAEGPHKTKVAIFDCKYLKLQLEERALRSDIQLDFLQVPLTPETANLVSGHEVVSMFVNGSIDRATAKSLADDGVRLVALRCAGFNHVDVKACRERGISVVNVPAYSPYAVAEFAVALLMAVNRKIIIASNRIRHGNFALQGLSGMDMHGKTVGVLGTGRIGRVFINIMLGFGCRVLACDPYPAEEVKKLPGVKYVDLHEMFGESDVLALFAPSTPENRHIVNRYSIGRMKKGVIIINTARGGLVKTNDLIDAVMDGYVAGAGLDVIEEEDGLFYEDHSMEILRQESITRLITMPNVILTSHMSFMTREALGNIADSTMLNISEYAAGKRFDQLTNFVKGPA